MKYRSAAPMRAAKAGYVVLSALFCVVGALSLLFPEGAAAILGRVLGVCLILFGIVKLVGYLSKDLYRLAFQYDLAFGILLMALGIITLARPDRTLGFLCVMLGVTLLADGLLKVQISIDARRFGITRWPLILALAILTGGLGVVLIVRPADSAAILAMLLGVSLLAEGLLNLSVALCTVKIIDHQRPDVIEPGDYKIF